MLFLLCYDYDNVLAAMRGVQYGHCCGHLITDGVQTCKQVGIPGDGPGSGLLTFKAVHKLRIRLIISEIRRLDLK